VLARSRAIRTSFAAGEWGGDGQRSSARVELFGLVSSGTYDELARGRVSVRSASAMFDLRALRTALDRRRACQSASLVFVAGVC
jgi:hypothetical protein